MVSSPAPSTPAGGIVQRGAERLIPASKRPDGSVRKEKKVREGFVPAEDVAKYQTVKARERAAANGVVPGRPVVSEALPPQTETPLSTGTMTKTQQKNVKRRLKRQQQSLEQGVQQQQPVEESPAEIKTLKQGIALLLGEMLVADITDVCEALAFEHDTWNRSEKIQAILERVESGCHNTVDLTVQYAKMTALRESLLKLGLSRSGDRDALVSRLQEALARLPGTEAVPDLRWSATAKKQEAQRSQAEEGTPKDTLGVLGEPKDAALAELAESRAGLYEKKCKTLKKRLRQIQQLQDKMDKGEKLIPEQLEKLASRSAAEKELADLEAAFSGITISSLVDTIKQR